MRKLLIPFLMISLFFWMAPTSTGSSDQVIKIAPASKAFMQYLKDQANGSYSPVTQEGFRLGYIPSPVDLAHVQGPVEGIGIYTFPPVYDLRTLGKVTAVKDQGACGSCWAFATFASLESFGLTASIWDFSEQHLNANHGFDFAECAGGNSWMSTAYMARWSGPLAESDLPYPYAPAPEVYTGTPQKHIQAVTFLPNRPHALHNDVIKFHVTNYGAVYFAFRWDSACYNTATYAFYNGSSNYANHAVAVVGWDDNYPAANFLSAPPGDGAFIVKNSWGTGFGDNGYFYISYYDATLTEFVSFNNAEETDNYENIYQYDPLGYVTDLGNATTVLYGANIFTAVNDRPIDAVGFYTNDLATNYSIYVYTGVTAGMPTSGTLSSMKSGYETYPGYHTINLDAPVAVSEGDLFSVVIRFQNSSYGWPVAVECPLSGYASAATANAGESYVSTDGSIWYDVISILADTNACIKAYSKMTPMVTLTSPNDGATCQLDCCKDITWTTQGEVGDVALSLWKDGTKVGVIASPVASGDCSYTWTIGECVGLTSAPGTGYQVKIKEVNKKVMDMSDLPFTICKLQVTSPNGGEVCQQNCTRDITWDAAFVSGDVKLTLWKDGVLYGAIADNVNPTLGTYSWVTGVCDSGTAPCSPGYQVKIKEKNEKIMDYSDAAFGICNVQITSPNGGESMQLGTSQTITWTASNLTCTLRLSLWKGGVRLGTIADVLSGDGTYTWTVGQHDVGTAVSGSDYKVKIKKINEKILDFSDADFTLTD